MRNEIQRMSTEQQRQRVEISRLHGDVQRGNRMHEENNCMLLRMMQHLNLQDPSQGPQQIVSFPFSFSFYFLQIFFHPVLDRDGLGRINSRGTLRLSSYVMLAGG